MALQLWLLIVSCLVLFHDKSSFGISEFSPLYANPFIYGPEDIESGFNINLLCNLTRNNPEKEIPKYTFVLVKDEHCRKPVDLNLDEYVTHSQDGLHLRYPLPKTFQGKKTFGCVLKTKKKDPPPGCHTVVIGHKPGKPTVDCVSHGFRHLECTVSPSGEKLKNNTGLTLPRHHFSQSYQLVLHPGERKVTCSQKADSQRQCRYEKRGVIKYDLPDYVIERIDVKIVIKNLFGESQVTKLFNMCEIEQPVTGKIRAYNVKSTSVYMNWTVLDSLFPTDKEYFENTINCTSVDSENFNHSLFKLTHFFNNLQPYTMYDCVILTRSSLNAKDKDGKRIKCLGRWSEPNSISFRTRPSAPNIAPLAAPGMILKNGDTCQLFFFEIPKDHRNGIVNRYRISLLPAVPNRQKPEMTEFLNPSFDCTRRITSVRIAGRTNDGGWSPDRKVDFRLLSNEEHVDLELWKSTNGTNRYRPVAKFSKKLRIQSAFLVVCNCSKTCHKSNFDCVGMRQIRHPDPMPVTRKSESRASLVFNVEDFSLAEEKVSVHLSFRKGLGSQLVYAMSEWISCAYDIKANFTVKKSRFPAIKRPVVSRSNEVSFTFNREELACSATIVKPVYEIYTRVTCDGKLVRNFPTPKGSRETTVSVELNPNEKCEVEMSLDNKTFVHRYQHEGSSMYVLIVSLIVTIVPTGICVIIILCCVYHREKLKLQLNTIFETRTTKDENVTEPMMSHTMEQTVSKGYIGGYDSIEPANTTLETGRGSSEESFPEQGVNCDNTTSTRLLEPEYTPDYSSGYIEHEINERT